MKRIISTILVVCSLFISSSNIFAIDIEKNILLNEQPGVNEKNMTPTYLVLANKLSGEWTISLNPNMINEKWDSEDTISVKDFKNFILEEHIEGEYKLVFDNKENDYKVGNTIELTFQNKTKNEKQSLYINFSEENIPTFYDKSQAEFFIGSDNDDYKLLDPENALESEYNIRPTEDSVYPKERKLAEPSSNGKQKSAPSSRMTNATSKYDVYNGAGYLQKGNISSPYAAIKYAIEEAKRNNQDYWHVVQTNDNVRIFLLNKQYRNIFYKFQFSNFYGSTADPTEAKNWTKTYNAAHVIREDGIFAVNKKDEITQPYSHSYKSLGVPEEWTLEGYTGAYVYKKAVSNVGYRSISSTVRMSSAKLRFDPASESTKSKKNAYIYMSSNSNSRNGMIGCDIGLISAENNNGEWYLISNRRNVPGSNSVAEMHRDTNEHRYPLVQSTKSGDVYTPKDDITMSYSYNPGSVSFQAKNLRTGVIQSKVINDNRFDHSSPNITLMEGTSFVPNYDYVFDMNSGAYLKNVKWENSKVYTGTYSSGNSYDFNEKRRASIDYLLEHDTDNVNRSFYGSTDTINIDYSSSYKQ